jgi:hypothetical protein
MSTQAHPEHKRDEALEDSFPASDPPANSGITGAGTPDKPAPKRGGAEAPTGTPTSDRHAAETAHHSEREGAPQTKR